MYQLVRTSSICIIKFKTLDCESEQTFLACLAAVLQSGNRWSATILLCMLRFGQAECVGPRYWDMANGWGWCGNRPELVLDYVSDVTWRVNAEIGNDYKKVSVSAQQDINGTLQIYIAALQIEVIQ